MKNLSYRQRIILALFLCSITTGMGIWGWLKKPYAFSAVRQTATDFLHLVKQQEFEKAYDLTQKNEYTGKNLEDFKKISAYQICSNELQVSALFPHQSNGNRLRRQLGGLEVEMPVVNVDFSNLEAACHFSITLRHIGNGKWKIHNFQSHAG